LYAGIAGVFLFTSGLISGYYDNQVVFHRIPERIRRHPVLRRLFSSAFRQRLAQYIEHNLGALAGNFFLGCMLGTAGLIGFLTGLPIDIRHITFAAANTGLALVSVNFAVSWQEVAMTLLGIVGIGVMNFAVSFGLALLVAMRSRNINFREGAQFLALLGKYFRTNTREFFVPPRTT
jgi:site-specific recombinase